MGERPEKLIFAATHVVKGSRVLTWPEKAVWLEDYALDLGPEGAWITAAKLAERLGLSPETVETYRRRFAEEGIGLHYRVKRPGARSPGWVSTLPDGCAPRSQRPPPEVVIEGARRLDWLLEKAGWRSGVKADSGTTQSGRSSGTRADGGPALGGRGETPASASSRSTTLQPHGGIKDGEGAHAPEPEDGEAAEELRWNRLRERRQSAPAKLGPEVTKQFEKAITNLSPDEQRAARRRAYGL